MTRYRNHRRAPLSLHERRARSWFWTWIAVDVCAAAFMVPLFWIWLSIDYSAPSLEYVGALYLWLAVGQYVVPVLSLCGAATFVATLYHVVMK